MIRKQIFIFILRWAASSLGMYLCITWLGTINPAESETFFTEPWVLFVVAGLIFSIINSIVKPILKLFSLPLAILTLGLSSLIRNTAMVLLTIYLLPGVEMPIWGAVVSSIILSIVNGVLNIFIS